MESDKVYTVVEDLCVEFVAKFQNVFVLYTFLIMFTLVYCFLLLFLAKKWSIYTRWPLDPWRQLRTLTLLGQHFDLHVTILADHEIMYKTIK